LLLFTFRDDSSSSGFIGSQGPIGAIGSASRTYPFPVAGSKTFHYCLARIGAVVDCTLAHIRAQSFRAASQLDLGVAVWHGLSTQAPGAMLGNVFAGPIRAGKRHLPGDIP